MAGCSTTAAPTGKNGAAATTAPGPATGAAPKAAHGDEAALETVPWDQVGPGWILATWTQTPATVVTTDPSGSYQGAATTLYLVDPSGDRYPITTFPAPGKSPGPKLVDWSGDGERALFYDQSADKPTPIVVDLHTGAHTAVPIQGTTRFTPSFTLPSGKALLLAKQDDNSNQPPTLERVDLAGERELLFPTDTLGSPFSGYYLPTPDGTQLILGTDAGSMVLMGNDGTVSRTIAMPRGTNRCSPLRWWDGETGTTLLAYCGSNLQDQPQLWLMPIAGGAPTALTAPNTQAGDMDAWHVPAGTFVSTASQCGELILEKLNADGTTSRVAVPGTDSKRSIKVIGVSDDDLIVRAFPSCAPGEALIDYDPAANTSTVLLGGTVNGGSVTDALLYPGQE
jgi:TolB protein